MIIKNKIRVVRIKKLLLFTEVRNKGETKKIGKIKERKR